MLNNFFGTGSTSSPNNDTRPGMFPGLLVPTGQRPQQQQQQQQQQNINSVLALKQQLQEQKLEEERRKRAEELEKQRLEELARQKDILAGKGGSSNPSGDEESQGQQGMIGGRHKGGNKATHILESKKNMQGAVVPLRSQFTSFASTEQMDEYSPINENGEWISTYNKNTATNPACTWRSIYDDNGPMRAFMKSHRVHGDGSSTDGSTSRLVSRGGMQRLVRNDGPCTIGVFLINAPVSRSPENVLYKDRIAKIKAAYQKSDNGKKGSSSISLIGIIPPNTCMSLEDDVFYRRDDVTSNNLSATMDGRSAQQAWMNVSKEDINRSIINSCASGKKKATDRVVYVRSGSVLAKFLTSNFAVILDRLGEPSGQTANLETWWLNAGKAYPSEVAQLLTTEEAKVVLQLHPVEGKYVDVAKKLAMEVIEGLPFENIEEHQFFTARLCGEKWSDPVGNMVTDSEAHVIYKSTPYYVGVEVEMWFSIVTDMKETYGVGAAGKVVSGSPQYHPQQHNSNGRV